MTLSEAQKRGIGLALNEARLLGLEFQAADRIVNTTFQVLSLPKQGPVPPDPRVVLVFHPVGRLAASLRHGYWDDEQAAIENVQLDQLLSIVQSFGGGAIYGWNFIDLDDEVLEQWQNRLSLDHRAGPEGQTHSILLFQEGGSPDHPRHLDIWIWFDQVRVFDAKLKEIELEEFIAGGKRWWDGFYAGDARTANVGLNRFPPGEGPPPGEGMIVDSRGSWRRTRI